MSTGDKNKVVLVVESIWLGPFTAGCKSGVKEEEMERGGKIEQTRLQSQSMGKEGFDRQTAKKRGFLALCSSGLTLT